MKTIKKHEAGLIVSQSKETILKRWELIIKEKIPDASQVSVKVLHDSLPKFLEELAEDLQLDSPRSVESTKEVAQEHGRDRKDNTNFSIDQIIFEYFLLKDVIFMFLEEQGELDKNVYSIISKSIDLGIRKSAEEYAARATAKEAKQRAEQETALLRLGQAVDIARIGFFEWNIQEDVIYFSPKMKADWGISAGKTLDEVVNVIHPDDRERTMHLIKEAIRTRTHYFNEYRVLQSDGKQIWIQAQGQVMYDEKEQPSKFLGTSTDITETKLHQLSLQAAQFEAEQRDAYSRTISNSMPQIVWTARPDGFLDWYNDQWYEYTAMAPGTNWDDSNSPMHPEDIPSIHKRWKLSYETGVPYEIEYRVRSAADGVFRWHVARALPIKDASGRTERWVGTITNIHSLRQLQQELKEERDIRDRFISALTHDLRTPLTAT